MGLVAVDQLVLYPRGTRQKVVLNISDIFMWALRSRAQSRQLETARARKLKLQAARARRVIANADRRIKAAARKANRA